MTAPQPVVVDLEPPPPTPPSLLQLFLAFGKISLVSFGGGVTALMYREFVIGRRWVAEGDFMSGLALAQAMPGVNVTNLAIWLGSQLRGPAGAVVACLGALVPAALLIIGVGALLHELAKTPLGASALAGVAAAALGLTLAMGLRTAKFALVDRTSLVIFAIALIGAAVFGSIVLLVAILAPVSIVLAYRNTPDE
ncbi:chromate transporter [Pseudoxanthobacter sp. M-2]|uniref:chromate transporter n=1 Tax=Pseudoxanthobacter sp. M-2 TaxID=3078754 RepID=UPI0038FC698E